MAKGQRVENRRTKNKGTVLGVNREGMVRVQWDWPVRGFHNPVVVTYISVRSIRVL